jgi:hypothetical protein
VLRIPRSAGGRASRGGGRAFRAGDRSACGRGGYLRFGFTPLYLRFVDAPGMPLNIAPGAGRRMAYQFNDDDNLIT